MTVDRVPDGALRGGAAAAGCHRLPHAGLDRRRPRRRAGSVAAAERHRLRRYRQPGRLADHRGGPHLFEHAARPPGPSAGRNWPSSCRIRSWKPKANSTPNTARCWPTRSGWRCSWCWTRCRRSSGWRSCCTTSSPCRSTRSHPSSAGRRRPPASWPAGRADASRRPIRLPTATWPPSGRPSTHSSRRAAAATSTAWWRCCIPTWCCAATSATAPPVSAPRALPPWRGWPAPTRVRTARCAPRPSTGPPERSSSSPGRRRRSWGSWCATAWIASIDVLADPVRVAKSDLRALRADH